MGFEIRLEQVTRQFGEFTAVRPISETILEGERISLLGHNGAGKSTLLNMLATLTRPSSGSIKYLLDGKELQDRVEVRALLAYLSHEPMLYPDLTAEENLRFVAGMYHIPFDQKRLKELLEMVGMSLVGDRLFRNCSRGMQQRLAIARTLLSKPRLMFLDEPFSGLDSEGTHRLKGLFTQPNSSWLLVTHDLQLGYELATRFWILKRGKLIHSLAKADIDLKTYLELSQAATLAGVSA